MERLGESGRSLIGDLARGFRRMVSEQRSEELDAWLIAAESSEVAEMENFARALRRNHEAVVAAVEHEWSTGQVEGQINRVKLIKRQMYGRASFDLLHQRILGPPDPVLLHRKRRRASFSGNRSHWAIECLVETRFSAIATLPIRRTIK
jgi:hypothetical protein